MPVDEDFMVDQIGRNDYGDGGQHDGGSKALFSSPGIPAYYVMKILRGALDRTSKDPEFLADAERTEVEQKYLSAEDCLKLDSLKKL